MDHSGVQRTGFEGGNILWTVSTLPAVISESCDFLEKIGFDDEGIFRVTGSFRDIKLLKAEYANDGSNLDLSEVSVHSVAGVLTHFFNESEEPIIPYEIYDFCVECMELEPESVRLQGIKIMIYTLPLGNFLILKRFLHVLSECAKMSEVNKMNSDNLAIALSPTLIRPKEETIETLISHGETLSNLVGLLITHYEVFFDGPPTDSLPDSVPDTFIEVLHKSEEDLAARLPPNFMNKHGPRTILPEVKEIPIAERPIARLQAMWRGIKVRRKLKGVKTLYQIEYNRACWEYIKRESNFAHAMKRAIRDFETSLGDNKAGKRIRTLNALNTSASTSHLVKNAEAEVKSMVSGFKAIIEIHQMIYEELIGKWEVQWPVVQDVGELLLGKLRLFVVYNMYVDMYCRVESLMNESEANPELAKWMKATAGSSHCKISLGEVLTLPFQQIKGCVGAIQKLVNCVLTYKHDIRDTNNMVKLFALFSRISLSIGELDKRISYQKAVMFEKSTLGLGPQEKFSQMGRTLLHHGTLSVDKQWMYVLLFDDICVICMQTKDSFVYEKTISMKNTTIMDTSRLGFSVVSADGNVVYVMLSKRAEIKVSFFVAFQTASDRWKSDVFGVPLEDLLKREGNPNGVPKVVKSLSGYLGRMLKESGKADFFCMGSTAYATVTLRNALNRAGDLESFDFEKYELGCVVNALKLFLLELPRPVLDVEDCSDIFDDRAETELNQVELYKVIQKVPVGARNLLHHISELLASTMLHPSILGQTWGYTIYRRSMATVSQALDMGGVTTVIRALLLHYTEFCSPDTGIEHFQEKNGEEGSDEEEQEEEEDLEVAEESEYEEITDYEDITECSDDDDNDYNLESPQEISLHDIPLPVLPPKNQMISPPAMAPKSKRPQSPAIRPPQ